MKAKSFVLAFAIAFASEFLSYDIYRMGIFSWLTSGANVFFSFVLIPLGIFFISWGAISQRKEVKVVKISETTEFAELKKKVGILESRLASVTDVLVKRKIIIENPVTESGFPAVYKQYLAPEQEVTN